MRLGARPNRRAYALAFVATLAFGPRAVRAEGLPSFRNGAPLPSRGPAAEVTFATVAARLEAAHPRSLTEAVSLLPESLFQDYALMRSSESSRQPSTPDKPRAILFGGSGDLVMAYAAGGKSLEAIEYDRKTRTWNLYEIRVDEKGATVSEKNPSRCTSCHGEPPRPNWEPYLLWPGAYGERDGVLGKHAREYERQFVPSAKGASPYARLSQLAQHYGAGDNVLDPNTRLTLTLTRRNMERVAAEISTKEAYASVKWAALAAIAGCGDATATPPALSYLPADSAFRRRAEKLLVEKRKKGGSLPVDILAFESVLESAGVSFELGNASTAFELRAHQERSRLEQTSADPFSHGLGGFEFLADWGFGAIDPDVAVVLASARKPYDAATPRPRNLGERLSYPFLSARQATGPELRRLCPTFEKRSIEALRGFTPPNAQSRPAAKAPSPHAARAPQKNNR